MASDSDPWTKWEEKYTVHPETKSWYESLLPLNKKSCYEMRDDLEGCREDEKREEIFPRSRNREVTGFKGTVDEIRIPAAFSPDGIRTLIYKPEVVHVPETPTIIIYMRGGGLVLSSVEQYEQCIMSVAKHTDAIVVLPEYRSLPCAEDRFAPFTDVEAATEWVLGNRTAVGGVASSPIGVVGDSAGGQLALSLSYTFPGRFDFQVIVYPVADFDLGVPSMKEFWADLPGFNGREMGVLLDWCRLLEEPSQVNNPRVNPSAPRGKDPVKDPPMSANPPTLLIVADLDSLRDWGVDYAQKLRTAGVSTELHTFKGVVHGFFSFVEGFPTQSERAHRLVAEFVKTV